MCYAGEVVRLTAVSDEQGALKLVDADGHKTPT
jgi:hypothetical protein